MDHSFRHVYMLWHRTTSRTLSFLLHTIARHPSSWARNAQRLGQASLTLGMSVLLLFALATRGYEKQLIQQIFGFQGHINLQRFTLQRDYETPPLSPASIPKIQTIDHQQIRAIQPYIYKTTLLQSKAHVVGLLLKGISTSEGYRPYVAEYLKQGRIPQAGSKEILLSKLVARKLQVKVGDTLVAAFMQQPPRYRKLRIVGIYATHLPDIDEQYALCPIQLLQQLNGWSKQVGGYEIQLHHPSTLHKVYHKLQTSLPSGLALSSVAHDYRQIFDWMTILRQNIVLLTGLVLLVVCTNMMAIALIQLVERTAMVGLLQVLGIQRRWLWQLFFSLSMRLLLRGLAWGNVVALTLAALQHHTHIIRFNPEEYYVAYASIDWNIALWAQLNGIALLVVCITLLVTTGLLTYLRPLRAIQLR